MKKNLRENTIKAMALALAITTGSGINTIGAVLETNEELSTEINSELNMIEEEIAEDTELNDSEEVQIDEQEEIDEIQIDEQEEIDEIQIDGQEETDEIQIEEMSRIQRDTSDVKEKLEVGDKLYLTIDEPDVYYLFEIEKFTYSDGYSDIGAIFLGKYENTDEFNDDNYYEGSWSTEHELPAYTPKDVGSGLGNGDFTTFIIFQVGDGNSRIKGDSYSVEELNKLLPMVMTIEENAFNGIEILVNNSDDVLALDYLEEVKANGLAFDTKGETINISMFEAEATGVDENAFGSNSVNLLVAAGRVSDFTSKFENNSNIAIEKVKGFSTKTTTVKGEVNKEVSGKIVIESTYELQDINEGQDVLSWITNLPDWITTATTEEVTEVDGVYTLTINISGTPTKEINDDITLVVEIPNANIEEYSHISGKSSVEVIAHFEITKVDGETETPEKPEETETTTSGSSGGSSSSGGSNSSINNSAALNPGNTGNTENTGNTGTTTVEVKKELNLNVISLPATTGTALDFSDVPSNHWASQSIDKLSSAGIINGMPDGSFNVNGNSKRADVAIMLVNLLGLSGTTSTSFDDVSPTAYYANAVGLAKEYGIVSGTSATTFSPEASISRQDTMVMIYNILQNLGIETKSTGASLSQFSDTSDISGYALEAVSKLVEAGIINGDAGKINPKAPITRAEIAIIMDKLYSIIDETVKSNENEENTEDEIVEDEVVDTEDKEENAEDEVVDTEDKEENAEGEETDTENKEENVEGEETDTENKEEDEGEETDTENKYLFNINNIKL